MRQRGKARKGTHLRFCGQTASQGRGEQGRKEGRKLGANEKINPAAKGCCVGSRPSVGTVCLPVFPSRHFKLLKSLYQKEPTSGPIDTDFLDMKVASLSLSKIAMTAAEKSGKKDKVNIVRNL